MGKREEILEAFRFRHACKQFDPHKKIAREDFDVILEAGRLSPSSFGFEPWRFVVIQNSLLRDKLRAVSWGAQTQLSTASHYVAILCYREGMRFDGDHVARMMRDVQGLPEDTANKKRERFALFQRENHLLDASRTLFDWAGKQAYIALGNMMTAAAYLGIDSCAIEGADLDASEAILAADGLTEDGKLGLSVMAAFGYRTKEPGQKTRQSMKEVVVWVT
ncbi:MAG: NAD(P)H-dependent oxidoreductase [Burkholderiaceae bacterium]|jgi:nitroreductase|nr:NAD(P)H-dependent oxidoreductase [Burkholderiaceae bacterium]